MINSSENKRLEIKDWRRNLQSPIFSLLISALIILLLYLLTLASAPVFGDPTEYTVVANQLGFAHPPGYAFITLLGKLTQTLIPLGAVSQRMHFLAALSSIAAALGILGAILGLSFLDSRARTSMRSGATHCGSSVYRR